MPTNATGVARRLVARRGKSVTLVQTAGIRDDASDWDDETLTETSYSVLAVLMTPRAARWSDYGPAETDASEVDRYAFLRDDITPTPVGAEAAYPTKIIDGSTEYTVIQVDRGDGVYRLELTK